MAKWAEYLISSTKKVKKGDSKYISHVMLHADSDSTFEKGVIKTKDEVIQLIKNNISVVTIRWDYSDAKWRLGAKVIFEKIGEEEFLTTVQDSEKINNLENLFAYTTFDGL